MPDGALASAAIVAAEKAAAVTAAAVVVAIAETKRELHVAKMAADIAFLMEEKDAMKARIDAFDIAAQRYKGGFLLLIAMGGLIGWFVSVWTGIKKAVM